MQTYYFTIPVFRDKLPKNVFKVLKTFQRIFKTLKCYVARYLNFSEPV